MTTRKADGSRSADGVTVRMFCHGLGDCFLITIPQTDTRDYSILIDCGVAMGTSGETALMKQVVSAVAELTGPLNEPPGARSIVDLLVVTHEHRDHVSGFIQAADELSKIEFRNVWVAWTENRQDSLANELRTKHAKEKAALARVFKTAKTLTSTPPGARRLRAIAGVLAFYAPLPAAGGNTVDVAEAMARAGRLATSGQPACLLPGSVRSLPGAREGGLAHGVRAFVLGPPHDGPTLRRINPGKQNPATYEKKKPASLGALGMSWAWAAAMSGHASARGVDTQDTDSADVDQAMPFDKKWRKDLKELEKGTPTSFFKECYFAGEAQRRIDGDWLWSGAQQLALYMESYTNNTSLVLAFELPQSKKVLLFPGDAQVGNWQSWHLIESFKTDDGRTVDRKATELLANTVLYKVGHHGSHNATLRAKGLELMSHPELVAMLPVEAEAVKRLGYGEMPVESLVEALHKRTDGRVLQLDKKWPAGKTPGTWKDGLRQARLSVDSFTGGADGRALYMEYTIADQ